ncbi:aspartyl/asparaginyl beta-hydroxylase domain-containing protein [Aquabacterium sp. A7-Y]|uniref:aspartyl/asparaginyl beta-hydroxylase domain-containing protein n=1 Tax=Aquabacterium sp. A7-Y TaxID=1349605 RepID=UPI00223E2A68|nr:aspartyl/asparaginyl beta-hydroxylase domain-containing protein [Aquabacterium sp. A7-Y]MCW7538533.1 aspartyl/asparaginyl beta-hydroxylase domain-containing protein [Aquabacterium sp. A7-Y]
MSPFERNLEIRKAVLGVMRHGGYYERIMDSGPELDRVKEFLRRMEQPTHGPRQSKQHPTFLPIFPGLDNRPMRSPQGDPVAEYLRAATPRIHAEALRLRSRTLSFTGGVVTNGAWLIYPLWYMGVNLPFMTVHCPELRRIAAEIPGCGMAHPFSEALLSWQEPHTHLGAHCSVDSLRLRYSVGVIIDSECWLRVGDIKKQWQVGESIVFEDCFEHEAWNGDASRLVFIIDTWHPDLTPLEREALQCGFRKREVREILYEFRMSEPMRPFLRQRFMEEDREPALQRYWNPQAAIPVPRVEDWGTWNTVPVFS